MLGLEWYSTTGQLQTLHKNRDELDKFDGESSGMAGLSQWNAWAGEERGGGGGGRRGEVASSAQHHQEDGRGGRVTCLIGIMNSQSEAAVGSNPIPMHLYNEGGPSFYAVSSG